MLKPYIEQQIEACSDPDKAAANISFNMIHRHRTASLEELQRRRDDLSLIIKAASPSRAADLITTYMKDRQLIFLGSSNPEPLQRLGKKAKGKKATARALSSGSQTKVFFKAKAA